MFMDKTYSKLSTKSNTNKGLFHKWRFQTHQWKETIKGRLSCKLTNISSHNFYTISDICTYKLNVKGQLLPCNKGDHLQKCQMYECNMMFKCPNFYCVPWSYVCDGKWDCPYGYDESISHQCGKRTCINMFKCKMMSICLHLDEVCNGHLDCPYEDDEYLCLLKNTSCPSVCQCLAFAVRCYDTNILENTSPFYISYVAVIIVNCILFAEKQLKKVFPTCLHFICYQYKF